MLFQYLSTIIWMLTLSFLSNGNSSALTFIKAAASHPSPLMRLTFYFMWGRSAHEIAVKRLCVQAPTPINSYFTAELLLLKLGIVNFLVNLTALQQLLMSAYPGNHTIIQHNDLICMADGGCSLGYDKGGRILLYFLQCLSELGIGRIIQRRGAVIQNQDLRLSD